MEIKYRAGGGALLTKSLQRVYLMHGPEDRLKQEAVRALVEHTVSPDFADFDLETLSGENTTAESILAAVNQIPFSSLRRVVVVNNMETWRERTRQAEAELLAAGILRLGDSACLILVCRAQEDEARRKTGITVKIDNAVKKVGAMVEFAGMKGAGVTDWIREIAAREGKTIADAAATRLVECVGNDMTALETEIIKVANYLGSDRNGITQADVNAVTAVNPEDVMFTLIEAIARRQTDRSLTLLGDLHRYDPKPQAVAGKLLALLARQYRLLWQARYLSEEGISPRDVRNLPEQIAAELPTETNIAAIAFKAADTFAMAGKYSWPELESAMEQLLKCDTANKGGQVEGDDVFGADPVQNLQILVMELTGAAYATRSALSR